MANKKADFKLDETNNVVMKHYRQIGIPLTEVGERLRQLNEAIKANDMVIKADSDLNVELSRNETALSVRLTVYLFEKEEKEKENG